MLVPKTSQARALFEEMKSESDAQMIQLESSSGDCFSIHAFVLQSLSPDFTRMVNEACRDPTTPCFLPYSNAAIWSLLQLAYTGITAANEGIVEEQLQMAASYSLPVLTKIASNFLVSSLTVDNWEINYRLGQKFLCEHSLEKMIGFICRQSIY